MAEPEKVYRCDDDHCDRVVATLHDHDKIVVKARHGSEWHETEIESTELTDEPEHGN